MTNLVAPKAFELNDHPMLPPNKLVPPSGQREAVAKVVDAVVDEFRAKITSIKSTLDQIEAQALQSAASAKHALNEHIVICIKLNDEIARMTDVIESVRDMTRDG